MAHPNPIYPDDLSHQSVAAYHIWDGNMCATVTQSIAPYGLCSAAILVHHNTEPMECIMYDGHASGVPMHLGVGVMRNWVASKLNQLGTKVGWNGVDMYSKPTLVRNEMKAVWDKIEIR